MKRYFISSRRIKHTFGNKCNMFICLAWILIIVIKLTQLVVHGYESTTTSVPSPSAKNEVTKPRRNKSTEPVVEAVTETVWLGEGPHWDHAEQALYFVSVFDHTVNKYVPATGKHTKSKINGRPTFIIPIEGIKHYFLIGLNRRVIEILWDGEENNAREMRTIASVDQDNPNNRINHAKADPRGRLFVGTLGFEYKPGKFHLKKGSLYRFDEHGAADKLDTGINISNGMCWDRSEGAFYIADCYQRNIKRYDYDMETGNISNPKNIFWLKDHGLEGIVDGITIDTDGHLWAANFEGSQVLKIDPRTGKLLQKVAIPALQTTSLTWGGAALDELFVTSAAMNRGQDQLPPAGAVFRITGLGARGHPNVNVKFKD